MTTASLWEPTPTLYLRPYQVHSIEELREALRQGYRRIILCAPTGSGKCLAKGTKVLTYGGHTFRVEQVEPGMALIGPDSQPRYVKSISRGYGPMVEVVPVKGQPWRCNDEHILTLVRTSDGKTNRGGEIVDVSVLDWMQWSDYQKHLHKLFRVSVDFSSALPQPLLVEPYLLGLLLGEGSLTRGVTSICNPDPEVIEYCRHAANAWGLYLQDNFSENRAPSYTFSQGRSRGAENPLTSVLRKIGVHGDDAYLKHVPHAYQVAPREERLQLLAGLLDTDGHLSNGYFDYISASRELAEDVAFVARSVGLAAYVKQCEKGIASTGFRGTYHRVSISGDVDMIPTRVTRKQAQPRQQKKDVLRTGFHIQPVGDDDYYGFTLTGDGRYLLGDFTVTHNTEMAIHLVQEAQAKGRRVTFVVDSIPLVKQTSDRFAAYGIPHGYVQGKNTQGRGEHIQVAMAQTIEKRGYWNSLDLLIIDECFHPSVEILTAIGWRRFDNLPEGIRVAQWDSGGIDFVVPTKYVKRSFNGDLVRLYSDSLADLSMTPNHELLLHYAASDQYKKEPVVTAKFNSQKRIPVAGQSLADGPADLTPFERLMIALQADGSVHHESDRYVCTLAFSFVKQRKIDRLYAICHAGDFHIREMADTSDSLRRRFMVYGIPGANKIVPYHFELPGIGYEKARAIIAEMVEWDGSKLKDGGLYYSSIDEAAVDFYQSVAVLAGYKARKTLQRDSRSESFSDVHRLFISPAASSITTQALKRTSERYTGDVYCVQVPSGNIVVRRNGKVLVTGNCHIQHKKILQFAREWGGPVIGLSATPLTKGLSETYQHIVNSTTTDTLLAEGWLAPLRIYAATEIDMAGASKDKAGEWARSEVRNRGGKIVGDIVSEYAGKTLQHFGGPVKTLVFSADVAHGEELCRAFQAQGYDFRQSTYHDSDADTDRLVEGFRQGEFTGLVSVAKFVKGFDVKDVLCGIDARPNSSSLSEVIQKMGRVMRSSPGKDYGLWLDHAGNMAGWYDDVCDIWENGVERLPDPAVPKKSRKEGRERQEVVCLGCRYVLPPKAGSCPYCGKPRSRARTSSTTVPGRMEEWARSQPVEWMKDESWVWSQVSRLALERTHGDVDAAQKKCAGYYKGLYERWPQWGRPLKPCDGPVDERVLKRVQYNRIRYAKSRRGA